MLQFHCKTESRSKDQITSGDNRISSLVKLPKQSGIAVAEQYLRANHH